MHFFVHFKRCSHAFSRCAIQEGVWRADLNRHSHCIYTPMPHAGMGAQLSLKLGFNLRCIRPVIVIVFGVFFDH